MVKALFGLFFFITQFPSLNFRHSSLITHHSKYYTRLALSLNFHHSIFFTLFVGPIPVTHCRLFFFLPKLTEPSEKRERERERERNPEHTEKKKRNLEQTEVKKKKKRTEQPRRK